MQELTFNIPVGRGNAHAKLFQSTGGDFGLTLVDGDGRPVGNGRTLSAAQAGAFARTLEHCKPHMRLSLVWAALGYERKSRKAVASAMCHPGTLRLNGKAR